MRRSTGRSRRRRRNFEESEDLNPMNYVSNLSDVMLILAVGIMLALILHWNVNIEVEENTVTEETQENADAISFEDSDLEDDENLPDGAEQMGKVFYDSSTGKYYIIKDADSTQD